MDIEREVVKLRQSTIPGKCVDLVPYTAHDRETVVRLRNLPEARFGLNLDTVATVPAQAAWDEGYRVRNNDIYWTLRTKSGQIVGLNRLYEISTIEAEKGSLIVEEKFSRAGPFVLESELLLLETAFEQLQIGRVITRVRRENNHMLSINARLGFTVVGTSTVRGEQYDIFELPRAKFSPSKLKQVLEHWSKRNGI